MTRRRKHGILSAMLAASLALTSMTTVLAAAPVPTDDEAIALLQSYGIIKGDETGNLNLDKQITRAEAATIFVRALGQESAVPLMAGLVTFDDAKGHWGAGYIAIAAKLGVMKGRSETQFDPDALITNQEVYTVLLRLVQREPIGAWNPTQIMQISADLGLTPTGINPGLLGPAQALRGTIFRSLGKAVSSLELADGRTVLNTYVDFLPPILRLEAPPSAVGTSTVRLTGSAEGAAYLLVGSQKVSVPANGRFSVDVPLTPGSNSFEIKAIDWAGNEATQSVSVTRAGNATSIVVVGEVSVKAGQTVPLQAIAYDANGVALPGSAITATVSGNLGSYNATAGTFTAGNNAGAGTITFKAGTVTKEIPLTVLGLSAEAKSLRIKNAEQVTTTIGKFGTVTVEVLDDEGKVVTADDGRTISLTATGLTGLSVQNATAQTVKGVATFTVTGNKEGVGTLTASSNGLGTVTGSITVATATRILLSTVTTNPVADGNTPVIVRAQLVNEKGDAIANNTGSDIRIEIDTNSTTTVPSSDVLIIGRGKYTSEGTDAALTPGLINETVAITGKMLSSHNYTVVGTSLTLTEIKIGAPAKLDITTSTTARSPGQSVNFTVRVVDSNGVLVPTGSYGFQVIATTTNGETVLPEDADATVFGYDIEKGQSEQVARTKAGTATVTLTYPKSGRVTLKVVPVAATDDAVDSTGEIGETTSATSLQAGEATATYSGTPSEIVLKWDVLGLENQDQAALLGNGSATAKLKVYVYDAYGGRIPTISGNASIVDLTAAPNDLNGAVSRSSVSTTRITEGAGEFIITSKSVSTEGTDTWRVTFTPSNGPALPAETTTLHVVKAKLDKPAITDISGGESGLPDRVLASDTFMQIGFDAYSSGTLGYVKVLKSSGTAVWTSDIIDLGNGFVNVPKSALPTGGERYSIVVNNGAGESTRSDLWPSDTASRVVVEKPLKIDVTGARYDAANNRLIITAGTSLSGGVIDPTFIAVENLDDPGLQYLSGATCTISSSSITCTGGPLADGQPLDDTFFHGRVRVVVEPGWWIKASSGESAIAEEKTDNNWVYPSATLSGMTVSYIYKNAVIDGAKITLTGTNLDKGRISLGKLKVGATPVVLGSTTITSTSSTTATFNVSKAIATALADLDGSTTLTAEQGWLTSSQSDQTGEVSGVSLFADVKITSISYDAATNVVTIRGSGFSGATVDESKFIVKERVGTREWDLGTGVAEVEDDTTITITFASNPAWETGNSGKLLFSTVSGWLTTSDNWMAQGTSTQFRPTW